MLSLTSAVCGAIYTCSTNTHIHKPNPTEVLTIAYAGDRAWGATQEQSGLSSLLQSLQDRLQQFGPVSPVSPVSRHQMGAAFQ